MERKILFLLLALSLILTSCSAGPAQPTALSGGPDFPSPTALAATGMPVVEESTAPPTCASEDVRKLAESIAADYAFTNTDEVLTWFCSGAEIEDIMVALQTEELTAVPAEDMLKMRADGLTWEEIWQTVGLEQ
jgi:hypothetical protein